MNAFKFSILKEALRKHACIDYLGKRLQHGNMLCKSSSNSCISKWTWRKYRHKYIKKIRIHKTGFKQGCCIVPHCNSQKRTPEMKESLMNR